MIVIALASGIGMMVIFYSRAAQSGADVKMPLSWTVMAVLGLLMMAIFGHVRFVLFKRLHNAVLENKWAVGGAALASIRSWVRINLAIGILIIVATSSGL